MPDRFWRAALVTVLCLILAAPASAGNYKTAGEEIEIGLVAVTAAIAVLVIVLVLHHKGHKSAEITGCIGSGAAGMTLTDDAGKRTYMLSGKTTALKTGDRVRLEGKLQSKGATPIFEVRGLARDFGVCRP